MCARFLVPPYGACGGFSLLRCECELWSVRWVFSDSDCVSPETAKQVWLLKVRRKRWTSPTWKTYLEKNESIEAESSELEHLLLGPEDADISNTSFAENARDCKFVLLDAPRGKGAGRGVEVADAAHFAAAAGDVRRREEASATRGSHTRPVQWSARPDPSQETPREGTVMKM